MDKQKECVCRISKAGPNIFAKIPTSDLNIGRGDLVKVTIIEKALPEDKELKSIVEQFIKNPSGSLKGKIMGYSIEIPFRYLINKIKPKNFEKFIMEVEK